jgi:4-hydroxy-tetrahydrodipicolinate synthase
LTVAEALERRPWGVLATPFTADGAAVDYDSLVRELRSQTRAGARGLTTLGVFGEAASLTLTERSNVLRRVATETDLPFVVGFPERGADLLLRAVNTLVEACPCPPRALMAQIASNQPDVVTATVCQVAIHGGLPIVLQDYPLATGACGAEGRRAHRGQQWRDACGQGGGSISTAHDCRSGRLTRHLGVRRARRCRAARRTAGRCVGSHDRVFVPHGLAQAVRAREDEGLDATRRVYAGWLPSVSFEAQGRFALAVRKEALLQRGVFVHATMRAPARSCRSSSGLCRSGISLPSPISWRRRRG